MRHGIDGYKLGRLTQHRWSMFRSLLTALFRHERITTTEAKAKAVRGLADQIITLAKRENLHARRQVLSLVPDTDVVHRIFDTIAARYGDRHGGYTRIIHAGTRRGDAAPMVLLELVDRVEPTKDGKGKKAEKKEKPPKAEGKGKESGKAKKKREKAAAASA
ncbi:MAG: 50S ribosomal protein L17 [Candidatus Rokubacteria bacterium]|nr:50S ribosomal protein L17 [Candidatus Rokubacteria bacterium]